MLGVSLSGPHDARPDDGGRGAEGESLERETAARLGHHRDGPTRAATPRDR
jgi:hypothetical protein